MTQISRDTLSFQTKRQIHNDTEICISRPLNRSAPPPYEETAPLISESPKNYSTVQEYDKDKEFDQSEEHKLKDFQLIRVPQKAVSSQLSNLIVAGQVKVLRENRNHT